VITGIVLGVSGQHDSDTFTNVWSGFAVNVLVNDENSCIVTVLLVQSLRVILELVRYFL